MFDGNIILDNIGPVADVKITSAPLPEVVVLSLWQQFGSAAKPCVKVGDKVLTGQIIATCDDDFCVPLHSSISGVVTAIDEQKIAHKSGLKTKCITIKSDGEDNWIDAKNVDDFRQKSKSELLKIIQNAGIIGLGGAGFPTHIKLKTVQNCDTIIINGSESEPGIMCDDALMQYHPKSVLLGCEILLFMTSAKCAIIAIEDDKIKAFEALTNTNKNPQINIQQTPTKYTSGAEKLLIKSLLNIEIPAGDFAINNGVLCQNVATVKAIFDAVIKARPLVSRIITVIGSGIKKPDNYEVRLGTQFADIIKLSAPTDSPHNIRMGGMMMGVDVANDRLPISKISNCIFVNEATLQPSQQPCIRCGQCNQACPVGLLPQQLFWWAKSQNIDKANDYNLRECIECRCCDFVCPSHIPLASYFAFAKALDRKQIGENELSSLAKERFEYREYRLKRNKKERDKMIADKKRELKAKMATEQAQKDQIAAAAARIKKTKEQQ